MKINEFLPEPQLDQADREKRFATPQSCMRPIPELWDLAGFDSKGAMTACAS